MQYVKLNKRPCVPITAVTGNKNSGKTTAVEELVRYLGGKGYRLGTLKHCHCDFEVDYPGKDSWRHRKAGSAGTAIIGTNGIALVSDRPVDDDPERLAAWLFPDCDLVLAEGFHWLPLPRVEILNADGATREAHSEGECVAQLSHRFDVDEVARVGDLLIARFPKSENIGALA